MKKKILLLNPPGREIYLRDYYCSKVTKADYINAPTDLVILSGILSELFDIEVLDAIVEPLSTPECLAKIEALKVEAAIGLIGAASIEEDLVFYRELSKGFEGPILVSGDAVLEDSKAFLEAHPFIDGVVTNFASSKVAEALQGFFNRGIPSESTPGVVWRGQSHPGDGGFEVFSIPRPLHELFLHQYNYRYPFVQYTPVATVLTSYGCPFPCSFCVMNSIPFRDRPVEEVIEELSHLKKMGVQEVYFNDQTFGLKKDRREKLLEAMKPLEMSWACFFRTDLADEETLVQMKEAGCHTILFGVESGNDGVLKLNKKGISKETIKKAFSRCRSLSIRSLATFVLGLPGDTAETCQETVDFALELDCDFASFNVAVPRMNTGLRREALEKGWVQKSQLEMDQSGTKGAMANNHLSREEIIAFHASAVRRFYLRPRYLLKRLLSIRSKADLVSHLRNGASIFRSALSV